MSIMGMRESLLDAEKCRKGPLGASCAGLGRGLRGVGAAPKRSRIDGVGIKGEHTIVEFAGGRRLPGQPDEIADIVPRLGVVARRVVGIERTMSDDDGEGMGGLDLVE